MYSSQIEAHVHYRHTEAEVAALAKAIIPLHDNIIAVSTGNQRGQMTRILRGQYFRRRDARMMKELLLRAVKHAKQNLQDYFPSMHPMILQNTQDLEDAVTAYWTQFCEDASEIQPTH